MSHPIDLKTFESLLDSEFDRLPCWNYDGEEAIALAANLIESLYQTDYFLAQDLQRGFFVLLPRLIQQGKGPDPDIETLFKCLSFGSHYYLLRDFLYYSYNSPGSCHWEFKGEIIDISFIDRSIPRQYFVQANRTHIESSELFDKFHQLSDKIVELLRGEEEFSLSENVVIASDLILQEAVLKVSAYYSVIPPNSEARLGSYNYFEFFIVYVSLISKALYHRYHSYANKSIGCVNLDRDQFELAISIETGLNIESVKSVIKDLTFSSFSNSKRVQPMHYPLFEIKSNSQLLMMPNYVCSHEGLIAILRVRSTLDPKGYLQNIAPVIDIHFGEVVANSFIKQGFVCRTNISLQNFDRSLPDIDLLVISLEPTLGFMVYVCELKAPIPATWSKDHLRVLNQDSVSKAFDQLEKIAEFLRTDNGVYFLRSLLPEEGIPFFGQNFVVGIRELIITSNNAGMFFSEKDKTVVDFRTLRAILEASDGDVVYINSMVSEFASETDNFYEVVKQQIPLGQINIHYDVVTIKKFLKFIKNQYKSIGIDKEISKKFIEGGNHPFDVF